LGLEIAAEQKEGRAGLFAVDGDDDGGASDWVAARPGAPGWSALATSPVASCAMAGWSLVGAVPGLGLGAPGC
jgi:hypothetical protein